MNIYDNILDIIKVKKEYPINNTNIFIDYVCLTIVLQLKSLNIRKC